MHKTIVNSAFDNVSLSSGAITAFQTTRFAPNETKSISSIYGQFNLGLHVGDNECLVKENRASLLQYLPKNTEIQWLHQVHGNSVAIVDSCNAQPITADAAVTSTKNVALAIMTADCLPILIKNSKENEIAAIHGGWRPLCSNIIEHTLEAMKSPPEQLEVWLGPCIGAQQFEVGKEVKTAFQTIGADLARYFKPSIGNKYLANLPHIAKHLLKQAGVKKITINSSCTVLNKKRYYSYRSDKITGRMASIIVINE